MRAETVSPAGVASGSPTEAVHAHHWRIDSSNGPQSRGTCRLCGAERLFRNWVPTTDVVTVTEHATGN
jgi:translation initiation factor IF-1